MVTKTNLSLYTGDPPDVDAGQRVNIVGGPLYEASKVLFVLEAHSCCVTVLTRKALRDTANLQLDDRDIKILLKKALTNGRYLSSEWCATGRPGMWIACDAYQVEIMEWNESLGKDMSNGYYVKFALGRSGPVVLLVSCHL
jgi:hypothetical protein